MSEVPWVVLKHPQKNVEVVASKLLNRCFAQIVEPKNMIRDKISAANADLGFIKKRNLCKGWCARAGCGGGGVSVTTHHRADTVVLILKLQIKNS